MSPRDLDRAPKGSASALDYDAVPTTKAEHGSSTIYVKSLTSLFGTLSLMRNSNNEFKLCTSDDVRELLGPLKTALEETHCLLRERRKRAQNSSRTKILVKRRPDHMTTPGSLVLAPALEPLGNTNLKITDDSRISTMAGEVCSKLRPQMILIPGKHGAITAMLGSRGGRVPTRQELNRHPQFKEQYLRVVSRNQKQSNASEDVSAIEMMEGTFDVREPSVLNCAALNYVRYQDIEDCYDGSHLSLDSVHITARLLLQNAISQINGFTDAHGITMECSVDFIGRPTDGKPAITKLGYSELVLEDSLNEQMEKRDRLKNRGSSFNLAKMTDNDQGSSGQPNDGTFTKRLGLSPPTNAFTPSHQATNSIRFSMNGIAITGAGTDTVAAGVVKQVSMQGPLKRVRSDSATSPDMLDGQGDGLSDRDSVMHPEKRRGVGTKTLEPARPNSRSRAGSMPPPRGDQRPRNGPRNMGTHQHRSSTEHQSATYHHAVPFDSVSSRHEGRSEIRQSGRHSEDWSSGEHRNSDWRRPSTMNDQRHDRGRRISDGADHSMSADYGRADDDRNYDHNYSRYGPEQNPPWDRDRR